MKNDKLKNSNSKTAFNRVKEYLTELKYTISFEDESRGMFVIEKDKSGIKDLVIGCTDPLLLMEQYVFELTQDSVEVMRKLLQKNRDMVHGAFALDESGYKVVFRDTLQIENLDLNELEGSLDSLQLLLSEFSDEITQFSKH